MIELNRDMVVELAKEIVSERPEFAYQKKARTSGAGIGMFSCLYVHDVGTEDEAPGCLVGQILHKAGISLDTPKKADDNEEGSSFANLMIYNFFDGIMTITEEGSLFLSELQGMQDTGYTWGVSLNRAMDLSE